MQVGDIVFEVYSRDFWIHNPWMKKDKLGIIVDEYFIGRASQRRRLFTVMWQDNTTTNVYSDYLICLKEDSPNEHR